MRGQDIPQRIPPLRWRRPAFIWTPVALAIAVSWPAAIFYNDPAPQRLTLVALFAVFAVALVTLGASWAMGHAPKARRVVVLHVIAAGVIVSLMAPFVLTQLLAAVAPQNGGAQFGLGMSLAILPLALLLGLPITLLSGIAFAWLALVRDRSDGGDLLDDGVFRSDVQPFR